MYMQAKKMSNLYLNNFLSVDFYFKCLALERRVFKWKGSYWKTDVTQICNVIFLSSENTNMVHNPHQVLLARNIIKQDDITQKAKSDT